MHCNTVIPVIVVISVISVIVVISVIAVIVVIVVIPVIVVIRGGFRGANGASAPLKIFYLYVTATMYSMKISFNYVLSFINVTNYVYSYII